MSERYQIKERIGHGGLGEVFVATDTQLQREVALKRMKPVEGTSPDDLLKEAKVLSALQHPNILTVYDVGRDASGAFVITELLRGETLEQVVARGALTYEDFRQVAVQSLEGLIAAQAMGLVHRDIKPGNIMVIWHASGKFQLKILDFGLAKFSRQPSKQTEDQEEGILGSIFFMAPEQFERLPLDGRTDLYAMGCIYYFALTANHPFDGETAPAVMASHLQNNVVPLGTVRPDLPPWLCDWVMWLINRRVEDRPGSAKETLDAFQQQASAWETAMQAAPMAAAAMAVLAAAPPPTGSSPHSVRTGRDGSSTGWMNGGVALAPKVRRGMPRWMLFLLPTVITAAAAGGLWMWKTFRDDGLDKGGKSPLDVPDSLVTPAKPPPPTATESTPPKVLAPGRSTEPKPPRPAPVVANTGPLKLTPLTIPVGSGDTVLAVDHARIIGADARPRTSVRAIGHWTNPGTKVAWQLDVEKSGRFAVSVQQSTDDAAARGTYRIDVDGQKLGAEVKPTSSRTSLQWVDLGTIDIKSGDRLLVIEPTAIGDKKNGLMNLSAVKLKRQ